MNKPKWDATLPEKAKLAMQKASESEIEEALKHATQFLEALPWKGQRVSSTQALSWPRKGVFRQDGTAAEGVPEEVKHACCEVAGFILAKIPFNASSLAYVFAIAGDFIEETDLVGVSSRPTWH